MTPHELPTIEAELLKYNGQTKLWEDYGKITTSDPDQMDGLMGWFRNHTTLTEDDLFRARIGR